MHIVSKPLIAAIIIMIGLSVSTYHVLANMNISPIEKPKGPTIDTARQANTVEKYKIHNITTIAIAVDEKLSKWYDENTVASLIEADTYTLSRLSINTIVFNSAYIGKLATEFDRTDIKIIVLAYSNVNELKQLPFEKLKHTNIFIIIVDDIGKGINSNLLNQMGYPVSQCSGEVMTEKGMIKETVGAVMIGYPYGVLSVVLYSVPKDMYKPLDDLNDITASAISVIDHYYDGTLPALLNR